MKPAHKTVNAAASNAARAAQKARNLALLQIVEAETAAAHLDT